MENIERLEDMKRAKRLLQEVQTSSFNQIGKGSEHWFGQLNISIGALSVAIQKLEKELQ